MIKIKIKNSTQMSAYKKTYHVLFLQSIEKDGRDILNISVVCIIF